MLQISLRFCPHCGTPVVEQHEFCLQCEATLDERFQYLKKVAFDDEGNMYADKLATQPAEFPSATQTEQFLAELDEEIAAITQSLRVPSVITKQTKLLPALPAVAAVTLSSPTQTEPLPAEPAVDMATITLLTEPLAPTQAELLPVEPAVDIAAITLPAEPLVLTQTELLPAEPAVDMAAMTLPTKSLAPTQIEPLPAEPLAPIQIEPAVDMATITLLTEPLAPIQAEPLPVEPAVDMATMTLPTEPLAPTPTELLPVELAVDMVITQPLPVPSTTTTSFLHTAVKVWGQQHYTPLWRRQIVVGLCILLLLFVGEATDYGPLTVATLCRGIPQTQKSICQEKAQLDQALREAAAGEVPPALLQPILRQEQQLNNANALAPLVNTPPIAVYGATLAQRYHALLLQTQEVTSKATKQFQSQAQQDMEMFQVTLIQAQTQNVGPIALFSQQFSQDQLLLESAHSPKDYAVISLDARTSTAALNKIGPIAILLAEFQASLAQMQLAHLDVTVMQLQYQSDLDTFNNATKPTDFEHLSALLQAQYQEAVVNSIQTFPFISAALLKAFGTQIHLLKTYGVNASTYQARLTADQTAMLQASSANEALIVLQQIAGDLTALQARLTRGEAPYLVKQFHHEVDAWAKANPYYDRYDGHMYALDNAYMHAGIGGWLDTELAGADTPDGFQNVVNEATTMLFNLHMLEADYKDATPYDRIHATDRQMLSHYGIQRRQVLMISLAGQAMRFYQNGALVRSFQVTTGRQELPALPGVWTVLDRKSPVTFTAAEPKGSPYWFPDTLVHHAILYHYGGDFVHDSWWRANYGPGTQFPHVDASGDKVFSNNGSHGCINLPKDAAAWVYKHTDWNTLIVIY